MGGTAGCIDGGVCAATAVLGAGWMAGRSVCVNAAAAAKLLPKWVPARGRGGGGMCAACSLRACCLHLYSTYLRNSAAHTSAHPQKHSCCVCAGPRVLEHIVDTVIYMEGGRQQPVRLVRRLTLSLPALSPPSDSLLALCLPSLHCVPSLPALLARRHRWSTTTAAALLPDLLSP